jgi:hypothetical protein
MGFQAYIKLDDYSQRPTVEYVFKPQWCLIDIQIQIVIRIHSLNFLNRFFLEKCCAILDASGIFKSVV